MSYKNVALQAGVQNSKTSSLSPKGENLLDLPEFQDLGFALTISNLLILAQGRLAKTGGTTLEVSDGTDPITTHFKVGDKFYYQTGAKIKVDDGGVQTLIKTFATTAKVSWAKFGNYLFLGNGDERVGYITLTTDVFANVTDVTAPKADKLFVFGERLFANDVDEPSKVEWAQQFTGSNPPFQTWSGAASPPLTTDPGFIDFGSAGTVRDITTLNGRIAVVYTNGDTSFGIESINVDGSGIRQNVVVDSEKIGLGGFRTLSTTFGVFVLNEAGIFLIRNFGSTDVVGTREEGKISKLFSKEFTEQLDFSDGDMVLDEVNNLLVVTAKDRASFNNLTLVYNVDLKAFSRIPDWNISRFSKDSDGFYGSDSITGKIYKLFQGTSNNGDAVKMSFKQELTDGDVLSLNELQEVYTKGILSPDQTITISFTRYDKLGIERDTKSVEWSLSEAQASAAGIGQAPIGQGGIGSVTTNNTIESFFHKRVHVHEYQRLVMEITEESELAAELNYASIITRPKGRNRTYT